MDEKEKGEPLTNEQLKQVTGGSGWGYRCKLCHGKYRALIANNIYICRQCGHSGTISDPPADSDAFYPSYFE
ncbi:MAG: hypothetical protein ABFD04_02955 [Syntrophomonas sp.]